MDRIDCDKNYDCLNKLKSKIFERARLADLSNDDYQVMAFYAINQLEALKQDLEFYNSVSELGKPGIEYLMEFHLGKIFDYIETGHVKIEMPYGDVRKVMAVHAMEPTY